MKDITRIHIAKVSYDIETTAKKQLESYIAALERYAADKELLQDIEIRVTELLAERGVVKNDVITSDDVTAVRGQLGEPHDFMNEDGDIALGAATAADESRRRLYRDTDGAVLGGVLSGIASYFSVSPLWPRLVFIALLLASFGTAAIVYVVLWIAIPPARTAAEKLQLEGKPVTLASIRQLNDDEDTVAPNRIAPVLQRVLTVSLGLISSFFAAGIFIGTIWLIVAALTVQTSFFDAMNGFAGLGNENVWLVWLLFWITIVGLLLFTALCTLIAYAFFTRKITKRLIVSGIIIVALGIVSVATVVGVSSTQSMRVANEARSLVRDTQAKLPAEFSGVSSLTIVAETPESKHGMQQVFSAYPQIRYVVDDGPARYELSALPSAKVTTKVEATTARIAVQIPDNYRNAFVQPTITIYGPALSEVIGEKGLAIEYVAASQEKLTVIADEDTSITATGVFSEVKAEGSGTIDLESVSVQSLVVATKTSLRVSAGTIRELAVSQPDACPSGMGDWNRSRVEVESISSGQMTYNTERIPAKTHTTPCGAVVIEADDNRSEGFDA